MFEVIDTHTCHARCIIHAISMYITMARTSQLTMKSYKHFFPSQIKNISLSLSRSLSLQVFTTMSNENVSNFEKEKRGHEICEYPSKIWKYFSGSFGGGTIFTRIRGTNSIKNRTKVFVERRKLFSRRGKGGGKGIIFVSFLIGKGIFPPIP